MNLKELAKAYGLNIGELATTMGFTRPFLYSVVTGKCKPSNLRLYASLELLRHISERQYAKDLEEARTQKDIREKGIEWLKTFAEQ